jgi:hypothetical protein
VKTCFHVKVKINRNGAKQCVKCHAVLPRPEVRTPPRGAFRKSNG